MLLGFRHIPFQTTMDRGTLIPSSQKIYALHLVLSLHRSGITTRPTSPCAYSHDARGISHERGSESELQTAGRLFDVLPIQQSHDTISFLAFGGLHEDKLCVTLQEAMTPANVKRFMKPPYSISRKPRSTQIVFADTQPAFPAPKRSKHAPIRFSRPHINTEVYYGGLKLMQLACEPASTFPKPCPSTQKGLNLTVRALYFFSHDKGSRTPTMMSSPLKTVWAVGSTGSTPPSTSSMYLCMAIIYSRV